MSEKVAHDERAKIASRRRQRWLIPILIIVGAGFLAFAFWMDVHDGAPARPRGHQPVEFVAALGIGLALFINGLVLAWRALRSWRKDDRDR